MSRRNAKGFTHSALRFPTLNSPWSPKVFTIAKLKGELPGLFDAAQLDHNGIEDFRATGGLRCVPFFLALKAEALHLVDRTFEALEAIREAEGLLPSPPALGWFKSMPPLLRPIKVRCP
jgi:hypothetical protein